MHTKVSIRHIDFSLLNKMHLEGVLIEDQHQDTLLYAGDLKLRITDWFIFKKRAELKYVGLENALIKFQRKDSIWSQQFLFDYLSPSASSSGKKKKGISFRLKELAFKNVHFLKKDEWFGEDLSVQIGKMNLNARNLQFSGHEFILKSLLLEKPIVAISKYDGRKPPNPLSENMDNDVQKASTWKMGNTVFKIEDLVLLDGTFKADKATDRAAFDYFDGKHILFTDINARFQNAVLQGDSLVAKMQLKAKERSGLIVKNMDADVLVTPQIMAFRNLELATNNSIIRNYYAMSYRDIQDMDDYIHQIKMSANFIDTHVDSDDIAIFAPALKSWKKKIILSGDVKGSVDNIFGHNMQIQTGNNTFIEGDISLTGLPAIQQTFIDFSAKDFSTSYADAVTMFPAIRQLKTPDIKKLTSINFKGNFTGFIRDFVTFGTIRTNKGTLVTDLNMKLPKGQQPVYSGNIATDNFLLGDLFNNEKLGAISMKGTIKGKGFYSKDVNTLLNGNIKFIDYNGYRYQHIDVNGKLEQKLFEGYASSKDENAFFDLNGLIDFTGPAPKFDLTADVQHADFRNLHFTDDSLRFQGKLNFNFTSNSIDNFVGRAQIRNGVIEKGITKIPFDSLIITSTDTANGRILDLVSNEFNGKFTGDFSLTDLPQAFQYLLNKYYPAYIKAPDRMPKNQDIQFDVYTNAVDDYLQLVSPQINGFNNSHFKGNFNLASNTMNVHANIPQLKFRQFNFDNVTVQAIGDIGSLAVYGDAYNIHINDSLKVPMVNFSINARNDSSFVKIKSSASKAIDTAELNALVITYNDGVKIKFDTSTFTLNSKTWTIDKSGELIFRKNTPASGLLQLSEGDQRIALQTEKSKNGDWNDLKIKLTKINLGDFGPLFLPKNRLEGLLSGNINVEDPTGKMNITSDDINTKFLRLDNDSLGEVQSTLSYHKNTHLLKIIGSTVNKENYLGFDANIYLNDSLAAKNNLISLKAKTFQISVLERFLGNLFSDINGYLTGDISLAGDFKNLAITVNGRLKDAGLKVNFTQCYYKIKDKDITLTPERIDLDDVVLIDTVTKNPIYISGGIDHKSFKDMFYDLTISTQKPHTTDAADNRSVQLLNTNFEDNKQFYGNVKGTGIMKLTGPQSDMHMSINATASEQDYSNITLPPTSSRESGIADFLVERKYGKEMEEPIYPSSATNIVYDVDVTANPMLTVKVILDDLTGDEIKGKGKGTLNIKTGTSEPMSIRGRFDIEEGNYLFTFQSFFKKPFVLKKGGTNYIEWNGDPYDANIKFDAMYTAEKVSFAPLASLLKVNTSASTSRGDVYVVASLTNKLFQPDISFSLDFPSTSAAATDPELSLVIQQLEKNNNELNRQVTYLIVFNSFAPSELADNVAGKNNVVNTISGILLNVLNDQINKILTKLLKNDKYNITLNTSIYNKNIIDQNNKTALNLGSNVNFSIGRSFFNNRFIVSTGVGFDADWQQNDLANSFQLLPDVTLEWLINESGTIRASFFYRENNDYLTQTINGSGKSNKKFGGSLSYRKDFNKLSDIFKKKKKKKKPTTQPNTDMTEKKETPVNDDSIRERD